jgi:hypothetical protein
MQPGQMTIESARKVDRHVQAGGAKLAVFDMNEDGLVNHGHSPKR